MQFNKKMKKKVESVKITLFRIIIDSVFFTLKF